MKKILTTMLVLMTFMSFTACSDAELHQELNTQEELTAKSLNQKSEIEADASHQWEANEKLSKLLESFGTTKNRFQEDIPKYPDYYGGAFITQQGKLVVYLHGDMDKGKQAVSVAIGNDNIEFEEAKYSYLTLDELMQNLRTYMENNLGGPTVKDIAMYSLRDMENKIVVYVHNLNEEKKDMLKNTPFINPAIELLYTKESFRNEVNLNAGSRIDEAPGGNLGSIAFRARNSGNELGFVTTGHLFSIADNAYRSGNIVGAVTQNQNSGSVDAAFVKLTNPLVDSATNIIEGTTNSLSTATSLPGVGSIINLRGIASLSQSGKVISTNAQAYVNSVLFTNLTEADYTSTAGDSGGLIYSYISSTGSRLTVGVHKGSLTSSGNAVFSKAPVVLSTLNLTRH